MDIIVSVVVYEDDQGRETFDHYSYLKLSWLTSSPRPWCLPSRPCAWSRGDLAGPSDPRTKYPAGNKSQRNLEYIKK